MNVLAILVRRELWEHRALWIAPLVVAALLILSAIIGHARVEVPHVAQLGDEARIAIFAILLWVITLPQYLVMCIMLAFYLLDCLYAERKDRSILFWKSLPVSDAATVLSKLLVALAVVPLGVYVLAVATDLVFAAVVNARLSGANPFLAWDTLTWLKVQGLMFLGLAIAVLWYAPIAAYLLLVSAWARRNVFLWAVLPPLLAMMLEEISLGSGRVGAFLRYRLVGIWEALGIGQGLGPFSVHVEGKQIPSIGRIFDRIDATPVFANLDLWLGLLAAAGFAWAAVRIRRYRDDT